MNILYLGPPRIKMIEYLLSFNDRVIHWEDRIDLDFCNEKEIDFIVSYGYQHIIKKDVIDRYKYKAINLHISYLPWNRGSDPNLWSFLEDTPKGVTIHYIDEGVDSGEIIVQKEVKFNIEEETLRTSYEKLSFEIEELFMMVWPNIKMGKVKPIHQIGGGTFHRSVDKEKYMNLLVKGWDTPVINIFRKAL
ncbi:hypothetical protein JCM39194_12420 [Desulfotomaculum varum]